MSGTRLEGRPSEGLVGPVADLAAFAHELLAPAILPAGLIAEAATVAFPGLRGVLPGFGLQDPNDWGLGFEIRGRKSPHWTGRTQLAGHVRALRAERDVPLGRPGRRAGAGVPHGPAVRGLGRRGLAGALGRGAGCGGRVRWRASAVSVPAAASADACAGTCPAQAGRRATSRNAAREPVRPRQAQRRRRQAPRSRGGTAPPRTRAPPERARRGPPPLRPDLPGLAAAQAVQVPVVGLREHVELLAAVGAVGVAHDPQLLEDVEGPVDGRRRRGRVQLAGTARRAPRPSRDRPRATGPRSGPGAAASSGGLGREGDRGCPPTRARP